MILKEGRVLGRAVNTAGASREATRTSPSAVVSSGGGSAAQPADARAARLKLSQESRWPPRAPWLNPGKFIAPAAARTAGAAAEARFLDAQLHENLFRGAKYHRCAWLMARDLPIFAVGLAAADPLAAALPPAARSVTASAATDPLLAGRGGKPG